jgi:threonylcarbamoyladenosine tRNA methylthiotransferase MtaB
MPPAREILTFGCRLNAYESEVIRDLTPEADADLVVINTCAVTADAERQARQTIRRVRRERPGARIVVTGCAAQISPTRFAAMPEVDRVVGNQEKVRASTWAAEGDRARRIEVGDIADARESAAHLISDFETRTRAFVQAQNGCDHRCTFCIIPFGRGPSRSTPPAQVVEQVRRLVDSGAGEIVLSGVDLTAYGQDLPAGPALGDLVRRILREVDDLPRLRLSSLDPVEIDQSLWEALATEERLMPHLHLSLQAADDMVLARMKRRHRSSDARAVIERARRLRPDIVFGADLIAGFPTESEEMFERTRRFVEETDLVHLHVFPYSSRPDTPAARMPQVPRPDRKRRAAILRGVGEKARTRFLDRKIGADAEILMETDDIGRTRDFARVRLAEGAPPGALLHARIEGREEDLLQASRRHTKPGA